MDAAQRGLGRVCDNLLHWFVPSRRKAHLGFYNHAKRLCRMVVNHSTAIRLSLGKETISAKHDRNSDSVVLSNSVIVGSSEKTLTTGKYTNTDIAQTNGTCILPTPLTH